MYRDRGSKFLAFAIPVSSTSQIHEKLGELKKTYHDARHHCYAYRLGAGGAEYRVNDDGEPSNSAGKPILGQIEARGLSNVLVVVVRYFGGTLLGVGGLIHAYREAASDALDKARIILSEETSPFRVVFPFSIHSDVMNILREEQVNIVGEQYDDACRIRGTTGSGRIGKLLDRINRLPGASAEEEG